MAEPAALWIVVAAVSTLVGFGWLALAMEDHWQQVHGGEGPSARTRTALRLLGWGAVALSAALCFLADRPSMAVLVWLMLLAGAAPSIAMLLARRPRVLRLLWPQQR